MMFPLQPAAPTFGECLSRTHDTAYIGKWHIDGHGRDALIPLERRLGFQFWRGYECTHDYYQSKCFDDEGNVAQWPGYDAIAQTDEAIRYISERNSEKPFALFLW